METAETAQEIAATARRLIGQYSWQMLGATTLAQLAAAEAGAPTAACYSAMGRALYTACGAGSGPGATAADRRRQAVAYSDVGRYLTMLARQLPLPAGGAVEDVVQDALLTVHSTLPACRQPAGFLAWAATIQRRQAYVAWHRNPPTTSLEALLEADPRLEPADPRARSIDPAGDQAVFRLLHDCLDTEEERLWALCVALGVKRRELGIIFDTPLPRFDSVGATVRRKLRRAPAWRMLLTGGRPP